MIKSPKGKKRRRLNLVGTGSSPWASAQVSEEARQRWGWPHRCAAQRVERPHRPAGWKRPRRKVNGSKAGSRRPLELDAEHDVAVAACELSRGRFDAGNEMTSERLLARLVQPRMLQGFEHGESTRCL